MKPLKLAVIAAAACSLVSQTAFAETAPQAAPAFHRVQPAKVARLSEKRHAGASADLSTGTVVGFVGGVAIGAGLCLAFSCNSGNGNGSSGT